LLCQCEQLLLPGRNLSAAESPAIRKDLFRDSLFSQTLTARAAFLPRSHSSASNKLVENTIKIVANAAIVGLMFSRIPVNICRGNVV
jgi:hypothetical protein